MGNVVRLEYAYGVCPKCKGNNYLRYLIHNDGLIHKPYEIKCINCNSYFAKEDILGSGGETTPQPITNADRIRAMSDEELAEYLAPCACPPIRFNKNTGGIVCPANKESSVSGCKSCWLDWLTNNFQGWV